METIRRTTQLDRIKASHGFLYSVFAVKYDSGHKARKKRYSLRSCWHVYYNNLIFLALTYGNAEEMYIQPLVQTLVQT
jgi:hypothetical protein